MGDPDGELSDEALENSFEDGASEEEEDDDDEESEDEPSCDNDEETNSPEVQLLVNRRPDG